MRRRSGCRRQVRPWTADRPASPARNRLVSLALRPGAGDRSVAARRAGTRRLPPTTAEVTLLEAPRPGTRRWPSPCACAQAAEDGPDRRADHARPDADAPGHRRARPLGHPARRQRRHAAAAVAAGAGSCAMSRTLSPAALGRAAADPAEASADPWRRRARPASAPDPRAGTASAPLRSALSRAADAAAWAGGSAAPPASDPAPGRSGCRLCHRRPRRGRPAAGRSRRPRICPGREDRPGRRRRPRSGELWEGERAAGAQPSGPSLPPNAPPADRRWPRPRLCALLESLLGARGARPGVAPSAILIWGTLEARVQGADLLILARLNEGSWPEAPPPTRGSTARCARGRAAAARAPDRAVGARFPAGASGAGGVAHPLDPRRRRPKRCRRAGSTGWANLLGGCRRRAAPRRSTRCARGATAGCAGPRRWRRPPNRPRRARRPRPPVRGPPARAVGDADADADPRPLRDLCPRTCCSCARSTR